MCEFKVYVEEEKVMEDVVFARVENGGVVLKDIIGQTMFFKDKNINEVNVFSTKLTLK